MTIKQLRAFLAVARTKSFAEAGQQVFLSQPALSLAIKKLEESLGGPLLTRTTRTVALTPEGQALYEIGQRLLADWDNTEEELQQRFSLQRGKVALAAMPSFAGSLLPSALLAYRAQYPNIRVEVHDVIAERVVDMVREGRIEIGITFDPGPHEDLRFQPLFNDEFIAVLPADHPDAGASEISWTQLLSYDFITLQRPSTVRQLIETQLAQRGMSLRVTFDAHQLATVGRMVATGLGVGAVPALCRQQMEELGAHCSRLVEPTISRQVGILTRARHGLSVAAEALQGVLLDTFKQ
ncbi:LysR family transcriptional regulator near succinyl-CoA:3-ketoacid-coenzyme A transferase [Marinobacterium lacunae]|uniref:LysR family transcriptional regulator near succinyl-CoA:3-ketoacid-coenzyme A transferase n=1 Tax=Marinobacterium lacunae TaxID=1232683 RepID=A0A081FWX4_9GAMM|nr:LysR family transcriptional regulator [Marinobacterium lacunae]KEA63029.1 LysR family transcriptional regulator near succinyl-CoA:3-ketoacid-coenzyme A transferase [Marinobacterium lacunae]